MKLSISEWNRVVSALEIAELTEQKNQQEAQAKKDDDKAKRAYIASENYASLREKISREALG